jgi:hypothetical protein
MRQSLLLSPAALMFVTIVAAQEPPSSTGGRVTVAGCVERAQRNGSLAGTGVGTTASPNTAATEANSGELVDAYLLTDAAPQGETTGTAGSADRPRLRYALEGHERELATHVSHRVQVVGTLAPPRSSGRGATNEGFSGGDRRVVVESVKRIGSDCSGGDKK